MRAWILTFSILAAFTMSLTAITSDDLFMYLALGRRLLTLGDFGPTDPFLFTFKDFPWNLWHEWLAYVAYYSLFQLGGYKAIIVLRALCIASVVGIIWNAGSRFKLAPYALVLVAGAALYAGSARSVGDRASLFSDLFITLLLFLLTDSRFIAATNKWKWFLPGLFLLWVQIHPGYLIGWAVLGLFVLFHFRNWDNSQRRDWMFIFGACVLFAVINPIGFEGVRYPIERVFTPDWKIYREINSEWMPTLPALFLSRPYKIFLAVLMLVTLLTTAWSARRFGWFPFVTALLLCYLGISAVRFLSLSSFGLGVLLATALGQSQIRAALCQNRWTNIGALSVPIFALIFSFMNMGRGIPFLISGDPLNPSVPLNATRFLMQQPPGNVFNEFDFGGFLVWELDGRQKIAAHSHLDNPSLVVQNYFRFSDSREAWNDIILANNVEYFLIHRTTFDEHQNASYFKELAGPSWRVLYADNAAVLFKKVH